MALSEVEKNYLTHLNSFIKEKGLHSFYIQDSPVLVKVARQANQHVKSVHPTLISSSEVAMRLARLSLYDIVLLLDDSPSMRIEEHGRRTDVMRTFLKKISTIAHYFDPEGISIRFLNHNNIYDYVTDETIIDHILDNVPFKGCTRIGTQLREKIMRPLVIEPARAGRLKKPVLITIITDGKPTYEDPGTLKQTMMNGRDELNKLPCTDAAVAFQIAQVGNDSGARKFVRELDRDPQVGDMFANVAEEGIEKVEATEEDDEFDPDLWLVRMMVGAIDKEKEDP